jgi:hypothetical protein
MYFLSPLQVYLDAIFDFIYEKQKIDLPHFADHFHKWTKRKKAV